MDGKMTLAQEKALLIKQRTIKAPVSFKGIGVHSGENVEVSLKPAPVNHGLIFVRTDLKPKIKIPAHAHNVIDTHLCTKLGVNTPQGLVTLSTVEHLMAALCGLQIDNLLIEVKGEELPIMDGSAAPLIELIETAGIACQDAPRHYLRILKEVAVEAGNASARLVPDSNFVINFEFDLKERGIDEVQKYTYKEDFSCFKQEIAAARTVGFLEDVEKLKAAGLAKGGSLENAVVFDKGKVLNKEGLRYQDEIVRHKIRDVMGNLYLAGAQIIGRFEGIRSGHTLNNKILRALLADPTAWKIDHKPLVTNHSEWLYVTKNLKKIMHPSKYFRETLAVSR